METVEDLKQNFVNLVLAHNLAFDSGNSSKANHLHNKIVALYRKIQQTNHVDLFKELMSHQDEGVRVWASGFCLLLWPEQAQQTLKELTKSTNIGIALAAKATLQFYSNKEWDKLVI